MKTEQEQILTMLQEGTITPAEAEKLLASLSQPAFVTPDQETAPELAPAPPPPGAGRFRALLILLLLIVTALTAWSGYGTYALYRRAERGITLGVVLMALLCIALLLCAFLVLWMCLARWLHVRIEPKKGKSLRISLPIPLTLTDWGLRIARRFVDQEKATYLEMGASLVQVMRHSHQPGDELLSVNIDQPDEKVQIYIR